MESTKVDIFRDTSLRYLGYANEIGESFKPIFPRFLVPSYGIAFAYVGADAINKTFEAIKDKNETPTVIRIGIDALLWQTFASVLIPGKVINFVTSISVKIFQSENKLTSTLPKGLRYWSPTVIGLSTIPFIIHPIDAAVDYVFDKTFRSL